MWTGGIFRGVPLECKKPRVILGILGFRRAARAGGLSPPALALRGAA